MPVSTVDALDRQLSVAYLVLPDGTALVEAARTVGLGLLETIDARRLAEAHHQQACLDVPEAEPAPITDRTQGSVTGAEISNVLELYWSVR